MFGSFKRKHFLIIKLNGQEVIKYEVKHIKKITLVRNVCDDPILYIDNFVNDFFPVTLKSKSNITIEFKWEEYIK